MIPPLLLLLSRLSSSSPELETKLVSSLPQVTATTDSGRQSSVERMGQLGNHSASGVWDGMCIIRLCTSILDGVHHFAL